MFQAEIAAISPKVETNTRNVQIRASLDNPGEKLLPGMFAGLAVQYGNQQDAVVIPETAVTFTLYGNSVFVVAPKLDEQGQPLLDADGQSQLIVQLRSVETGERRDAKVRITRGLKAGERVVTNGQLKLGDGTLIKLTDDPARKNLPQLIRAQGPSPDGLYRSLHPSPGAGHRGQPADHSARRPGVQKIWPCVSSRIWKTR